MRLVGPDSHLLEDDVAVVVAVILVADLTDRGLSALAEGEQAPGRAWPFWSTLWITRRPVSSGRGTSTTTIVTVCPATAVTPSGSAVW